MNSHPYGVYTRDELETYAFILNTSGHEPFMASRLARIDMNVLIRDYLRAGYDRRLTAVSYVADRLSDAKRAEFLDVVAFLGGLERESF